MAHTIDHLGPPMEAWWRDLGAPVSTQAVKNAAVAGVADELDGRSFAEMIRQRDDLLLSLLAAKAKADQIP
jgi:hypothetical protein